MLNILLVFLLHNPIITRHDTTQEQHLVNPDQFENVVQLKLKDITGWVEMEGTFIEKNWIITAAHGLTSVEVNQKIRLFDTVFTINKIVTHPDWDGNKNDIALIQLDKEAMNIQPVTLYENKNELNKNITITGRGWTGNGLTGPVTNDQTLRLATNKIDSVSTSWIKFRFDAPNDKNTTELEGISGPGDSGGPAFFKIEEKQYLVGISSHQLNEQLGLKEGTYGVIEYYTRVSNYIDWIEKVLSGSYFEANSTVVNTPNKWGFPDTPIGRKATIIMEAIAKKEISEQLVTDMFFKKFSESTNLYAFLKTGSELMDNPVLKEIKTAKKHVLRFTVLSGEKVFYIQFDAEKRNNYLIGGMIIKKIDD